MLAVFLLASQVAAQGSDINFDNWETFAGQAEQALGNSDTATDTLTSIRDNADKWREQFAAYQNPNDSQIQSVQNQIDALGAPPAEGETEPEETATRRAALNEQLTELKAPGTQASEALARARSIISQADQAIGEREAQEILTQTASPLLPASWLAASQDTVEVWKGIGTDAINGRTRQQFLEGAPKILAYLLAAIALLTFGRRFVDSLPSRLGARATGDARAVIAFIVSLGQILVPMFGIALLAWGLDAAGLLGRWLTPFLLSLPPAALIFFSGRWLVRTLFASQAVAYDTLQVPEKQRPYARFYGTGLAVMLALHSIFSHAALPLSGYVRGQNAPPQIPYDVTAAGAGVFHLVLMVPAAFFLFQLANILRRMNRYEGTEYPQFRARVLTYIGTALRILVVVTLAMMLLGYVNLANAIFWSLVKSLGLVGLLILLYDFFADLYSLSRKGKEGARESLIPMLIGFVLVCASIPVFLLFWGASLAELETLRQRIVGGFSVGGITISPGGVFAFAVVFAIGYFLTGTVKNVMRNSVLPRTSLDSGAQNAAVAGIGYVGITLAALLAITSAGINLSSFALIASALSVGIGFGLQTIVQNFVAGIILLIERPISVGDWVEAGGQQGIVQQISVRSTRIKTFDQTDVIVPNSDLISQSVTNWTRGNSRGRIIVPVGVAYGSDTRKVERILREIAEDQPTVLIDPAPAVLLMNFGADSLDFEVRCILSDISGGVGVSSEMRHQIAQRFADEGIEIPFAQRDLWLRNPETLFAKPSQPQPGDAPAPEKEKTPEVGARPPADIRSVGEMPDSDGGDGDGDGGGDNY